MYFSTFETINLVLQVIVVGCILTLVFLTFRAECAARPFCCCKHSVAITVSGCDRTTPVSHVPQEGPGEAELARTADLSSTRAAVQQTVTVDDIHLVGREVEGDFYLTPYPQTSAPPPTPADGVKLPYLPSSNEDRPFNLKMRLNKHNPDSRQI